MPLSGPGGTAQLNRVALRPHAMAACYAVSEGSGTTLTNLADSEYSLGNATITGGAGSWSSTDYFSLSNDVVTFGTATGDDLMDQGTISIVTSHPGDSTAQRMLISSSEVTAAKHGVLAAYWTSGADAIRVQIRDNNAGVIRQMDFTGLTRTTKYNLVIRWGNGLTARLNGAAPNSSSNSPSTYLGPVRTLDTESWIVGRNNTAVKGQFRLYSLAVWNERLTDIEVEELELDSDLPFRPPPGKDDQIASATMWSAGTLYARGDVVKPTVANGYMYVCDTDGTSHATTEPTWGTRTGNVNTANDNGVVWRCITPSFFACWANAFAYWVSDTAVKFRVTTTPWLQSGNTPYFRIRTATTKAGLDAATPTSSVSSSVSGTALDITVSGLTANQRYYYLAEWSADDLAFYPFPGGLGEFRPGATTPTVACIADDHWHVNSSATPALDDRVIGDNVAYTDAGAINSTDGWRNRVCSESGIFDMYVNGSYDILMLMGDHVHTDTDPTLDDFRDTSDFKFYRWIAWMNAFNRALKRGILVMTLGNHEGECGYNMLGESSLQAKQKQSTIIRKRMFANPTNGESGSNADWEAGQRGTAFVDDALLENDSPLGNYGYITVGDAIILFLDAYRYTDPAGTDTDFRSEFNDFKIGKTQAAWIVSTLSSTTKYWKIVCIHMIPGGINAGLTSGAGVYSRGSGADIGETEPYNTLGMNEGNDQQWLHEAMRTYGVDLVIAAHDHKHCHVEKNGVDYWHCPTFGAGTHTQIATPGMNFEQLNDSYSTAESGWTGSPVDHSGDSLASRGVLAHFNINGWCYFSIPTEASTNPITGTVRMHWFQTAATAESNADKLYKMGFCERFLSLTTEAPVSNALTLGDSLNTDPIPVNVWGVFDDASITGSWWGGTYDSGGLTDLYGGKSPASWASGTPGLNTLVVPTNPNGFLYRCTASGATGATEPTHNGTVATDWPVAIGGFVTNGAAVWTCVQKVNTKRRHREMMTDSNIQLSATAATAVRVAYTPMVVYTEDIANNSSETGLTARSYKSISARIVAGVI